MYIVRRSEVFRRNDFEPTLWGLVKQKATSVIAWADSVSYVLIKYPDGKLNRGI